MAKKRLSGNKKQKQISDEDLLILASMTEADWIALINRIYELTYYMLSGIFVSSVDMNIKNKG